MDFLTITNTAKLIDVSRQAVYDMIERGDLKVTQIGGRPMVSEKLATAVRDRRLAAKATAEGAKKNNGR